MESTTGTHRSVLAAKELAHPDRMRAFSAMTRNPMTRLELQAQLCEIAPTTLHRHLTRLLDVGLVQIVGHRTKGANQERIYESLPLDLAPSQSRELTPVDYLTLVTAMTADLVGTVQRFAKKDQSLAGRSTFGVQTFYASDDEHQEIVEQLDEFLASIDREYSPGPGRVQRSLSYGMCPREPQ